LPFLTANTPVSRSISCRFWQQTRQYLDCKLRSRSISCRFWQQTCQYLDCKLRSRSISCRFWQQTREYVKASLAVFDSKHASIWIAADRKKPASRSQLAKVVTWSQSLWYINPHTRPRSRPKQAVEGETWGWLCTRCTWNVKGLKWRCLLFGKDRVPVHTLDSHLVKRAPAKASC